LTFYADSAKADAAVDAAPRQHAPVPTQPEPVNLGPLDGVTELSSIAGAGVDGNSFFGVFMCYYVLILGTSSRRTS